MNIWERLSLAGDASRFGHRRTARRVLRRHRPYDLLRGPLGMRSVRRLFCSWFCACWLGQSRRSVPVLLRPHCDDCDRSPVRTSSVPVKHFLKRTRQTRCNMSNVQPQCRFVRRIDHCFLLIPRCQHQPQTTQNGTDDVIGAVAIAAGTKTLIAIVIPRASLS